MTTKGLHVLLVEDNPGDAQLIQEVLVASDQGYHIVLAETLAQAVQVLRSKAIDIILLDLFLPDVPTLPGAELAAYVSLKALYPTHTMIIITGLADQDLGLVALRQGAQDYFVKSSDTLSLRSHALTDCIQRGHMRALNKQDGFLHTNVGPVLIPPYAERPSALLPEHIRDGEQ